MELGISGLTIVNEAVSTEYAAHIVKLLPLELLGEAKLSSAQTTGSGKQAHFFRPLPECISYVNDDVVPESWRIAVWQDEQSSADCDAAIIQSYAPGDGIRPHVDLLDRFRDGVSILSLLSGCVMDIIADTDTNVQLYLPPRSLLLMRGHARYHVQHGISFRTSDTITKQVLNWQALPAPLARRVMSGESVNLERQHRISITMRRVLRSVCQGQV
ncbi:hypothetical protein PYCC9005_003990 [Savitreella phatthalungensis]